jgi:integrase
VDELRRLKLSQVEELLRIGVRLSGDTLACCREDGEPKQPRSLTHDFTYFIRRLPLSQVSFHDLRHSHATHMLASGVHPKVASERLGHSKVGITLDLYSHVLPDMQSEAAAKNRRGISPFVIIFVTIGHFDGVATSNLSFDYNCLEGWPSGLRHRS